MTTRWMTGWVFLTAIAVASPLFAATRPEAHAQYASQLWAFVTQGDAPYTSWQTGEAPDLQVGPPVGKNAKTYYNGLAQSADSAYTKGASIVVEHFDGEGNPIATSVFVKGREGYDAANEDWFWAHFLADGTLVQTSADKDPYAKRGFVTFLDEGRLWVFRATCPDLASYVKAGELAKHVILPGAGPEGMTLRVPDKETMLAYVAAKPGFEVREDDGRLWIFKTGSEELAEFDAGNEPAKLVMRPAAGPRGTTLKALESATISEYLAAKPGFAVRADEDGRIWVFDKEKEAEGLAAFDNGEESAKQVIRPGAGPGGVTLKGLEGETLDNYIAAAEGFETFLVDGRIWVFKKGSEDLAEFKKNGELAKNVTRPGAGPNGMTIRSGDAETLDAYQKAIGK